MYSSNYSSKWSNLHSTSISRNEQIRSVQWNINHPFEVSKDGYDVDQFYVTSNAPINYRATEVNEKLYGEKRYSSPYVYSSDINAFSNVGDTNATFTFVDEKGFENLGKDMSNYMEIEDKIENANIIRYDEINDPGNYAPYIQHKPLINDFIDELDYSGENISNRQQRTIDTNKLLMKNKIQLDNIVKGDRTSTDGSIDPIDLTIQSPTVDYTLFQPIHERYTNSVSTQSSSQMSVVNGDATSIHTSSQVINDNGKVTAQKSAIKCKGLTMNRCVPIEYENKLPSAGSLTKSESFKHGMTGLLSAEAFAPSMGVYSSNGYEQYAPPQPTPYRIEPFGSKNNDDDAMAAPASESYINTLKARATAVCFYLQHNQSYSKWANNWKFLYDNLHVKNRLLFQRLDESDADIAYVVNKGEEVKFRIRDERRFIPINIYQYVLYHEMAHMSTTELQHTKGFFELLAIIALAAFEMGFIDLSRMSTTYYKSNGQPILCRASLKTEINNACKLLIEANPKSKAYFEGISEYINKK